MRRIALLSALVAAVVVGFFLVRSGGSPTAQARPVAAPTWKDVAPVFAAKCASCHMTGGIAPFSLTTAASAKSHAGAIETMTQAGAMPPWMPGSDSPLFLGSDRRILTSVEKDLLKRWVDGGAQIGRGGSLLPEGSQSVAPGKTTTLAVAKPYMPKPQGGGLDDYHCFVLDPHLAKDMFVTSAFIRPQQAGIVHHVILFEADGENAALARERNKASGGNGWTCFGGPGLADSRPTPGAIGSDRLGSPQWISAWVPGKTSTDMPRGTGVLLHAGAVVVMQVHYNLIHPAHLDRSRAVLRLLPAAGAGLTPLDTILEPAPVELPCPSSVTGPQCDRVAAVNAELKQYGQQASLIPLGLLYLCRKTLADYPTNVGDGKSISTTCDRPVNRAIRIYGVGGHMHLRGVGIKLELNPGSANAKTLLHIPRWSFHWQDAYYLRTPIDANPGDTVRVSCTFDNSAAKQPIVHGKPLTPRYVIWGEGSTDEMCLGILQVAGR